MGNPSLRLSEALWQLLCMGQSQNIGPYVICFGIKIQAPIIGQGFPCEKIQDFGTPMNITV